MGITLQNKIGFGGSEFLRWILWYDGVSNEDYKATQ